MTEEDDKDHTYWTCEECGHRNMSIKKAYNYFCDMCRCWHSPKQILAQQKSGYEL